MASTRLTVVFTLPGYLYQESPASNDERVRFWNALEQAVQREGPVPLLPEGVIRDYERLLIERFGPQLRESLQTRFGGRLDEWEQLEIKAVDIRYGSALLDLDIFGLGALLKAAGVDQDFFIDLLEEYSSDALTRSVYNRPADGTGLSARVQGQVPSGAKRSLLSAMNISFLTPVLLALLVCYVAFVALHDEKVRYLDQNKVLLDHYQSYIDALDKRIRDEESRSTSAPPIYVPARLESPPAPVTPPKIPAIRAWIIAGDVLLGAAVFVLWRWGENATAKIVAAIMALGGVALHTPVHFEIKTLQIQLDSLFGSHNKDGTHPTDHQPIPAHLTEIGPELLMEINGFIPGDSALPSGVAPADIQSRVCNRWTALRQHDPAPGLILVVGSTDITRLTRAQRLRYESNFGLAQARAETVKAQIVGCVNEKQVLAMVAGPQHTPDLGHGEPPKEGYPDDRRVQVWGLWASSGP
jgi:hypothetical protein